MQKNILLIGVQHLVTLSIGKSFWALADIWRLSGIFWWDISSVCWSDSGKKNHFNKLEGEFIKIIKKKKRNKEIRIATVEMSVMFK